MAAAVAVVVTMLSAKARGSATGRPSAAVESTDRTLSANTSPQGNQPVIAQSLSDAPSETPGGAADAPEIASVAPVAQPLTRGAERGSTSVALNSSEAIQEDAPPSPRKTRIFSSTTEQVISGMANTRPGYPPPIIIRLPMGEDIGEILNRPVDIFEDDDEKTVEIKENLAKMKEEMKQYIAEGGTAENFLLWYHNELSKDYEDWKAAQNYVVQLLKDGNLEEAEQYAAEANADLSKRGVRNVKLPANLVKRIRGE